MFKNIRKEKGGIKDYQVDINNHIKCWTGATFPFDKVMKKQLSPPKLIIGICKEEHLDEKIDIYPRDNVYKWCPHIEAIGSTSNLFQVLTIIPFCVTRCPVKGFILRISPNII